MRSERSVEETESSETTKGTNLSFLEHLDDLRGRILRIVIMLLLGTVICYLKAQDMLQFLLIPVHSTETGPALEIIYIAPFEAFMVQLKIAFLAAIFLSSPYNFLQIWLFISPGLKPKEKRYALPFVLSTVIFFTLGVYVAWLILPMAITFFKSFIVPGSIEAFWTMDAYTDILVKMFLGFGLIFESPIIVFFLAKLGILSPKAIIKPWRFIVVGVFLIAGFLTPGPDIVSQLLLACTMLFLYIISIVITIIFYPGIKKGLAG